MQLLLTIIVFSLMSFVALGEQGTRSTDDSPTSEAEASLSGTTDQGIDLREEEVQMEEGNYDSAQEEESTEIEPDQEILDEYKDEMQSQP